VSGVDKNQLGSELVRLGIISAEQLEQALPIAAASGTGIETIVAKLGFASKNDVYRLLADKMGVAYVDLGTCFTDPTSVDLVPREVASRYSLFPMFRILNSLTVAMVDPTDAEAINHVSAVSGCEVEGYLAARSDILAAIERYYPALSPAEPSRKTQPTDQQDNSNRTGLPGSSPASRPSGKRDMDDVISLILNTAVQQDAAAVHIEPVEDRVRIRLRVGEKLREMPSPPNILKAAITAHLKALAGLSLSQSRTCQNGHFRCRVLKREILFRVSVLPTVWGESITLGVSGASSHFSSLDKLGFSPESLAELKKILAHRSGLLLLVGPPRSGKTTTLCAIARYSDPAHRKIVSIEENGGQVIPFCHQVRIDRRGGLDESEAILEALRRDADIVLVDELTSTKATQTAAEAALRGLLIICTVTAADAADAIVRLNQMGVEPSSASTSLLGVVAQRLLRRVCRACIEEYPPPASLARKLNISSGDGCRLARGKGCASCAGSGHSGRIAVFELVQMSAKIARTLCRGESAETIRRVAKAAGCKLLADAAIEKMLKGETSLEEASRLGVANVIPRAPKKKGSVISAHPEAAIASRRNKRAAATSSFAASPVHDHDTRQYA
jgi:type IV pilus assembly protein PilB